MQKKDGGNLLIFVLIGLLAFFLLKGTYSGQVIRSTIHINDEEINIAPVDYGSQQNIVTIPPGPNVQLAPLPNFCQSPIAPGGIIITTPGFYRLCGGTINLPSPIRILADDVILDCAGTTLIGTPNYAFNGIEVLGDRVTIKDCKLKRFKDAIFIDKKDESKVLNSEIFENINGIHLDGWYAEDNYNPQVWRGKNYEFSNNNIHHNQKDGIKVERTPAYWYSYATARIINNNINNNENGIHFIRSDEYTQIQNNMISSNTKNGIYLDAQPSIASGQPPGYGSNNAHIRFNTIQSNGENGLKIERSNPYVIYKNLFQNNAQNNILIKPDGSANIVSNNILNSIDGIHVDTPNVAYPAPWYQDYAHIFVACNNIKFHSNSGVNYIHVGPNTYSSAYLWLNRIENNNFGFYIDYAAGPSNMYEWASMNEFKNNQNGIYAISGGNRRFYHNNFIANAIIHAYDMTTLGPDEWDYTYTWAPPSYTHGNYWDDYSGAPDPSNPGHYYGPRIIPPSGNQDDAPEINQVGIPPDPTLDCGDSSPPVLCGDGVINQFWEQCDPPDMGTCAPGTCIHPGQPDECKCPLNNTAPSPENPWE